MKKTMLNRIGIAILLLGGLLLLASRSIAEDIQPQALNAYVESSYPPLSTFVPIVPCRAVDTRKASYWGKAPIYGDQTRDIRLYRLDSRDQGVVATDCVPSDAQAVAINLTAVPQSGQGYLTVWRYGDDKPLASSINYSSLIDQVAIANGIIVPMCPNCTSELNVYNYPGTTHFIIDVYGYWLP